jgi:hypothetical protein
VATTRLSPGEDLVIADQRIGTDGSRQVGGADVDVYRLTLVNPARLAATLSRPAGAAAANFAVRVFAENGTEITSFQDAGGYPAGLTDRLGAGDYFLAVSASTNTAYNVTTGTGTTAGAVGDYTLTFAAQTPDPDGSLGGSREVELVEPDQFQQDGDGVVFIEGEIGRDFDAFGNPLVLGARDVDIYSFFANDTGFVDIFVTATGQFTLDTYVEFFDADGNLQAFNDDLEDTTDSGLRVAVTGGQEYFVAVANFESRNFDLLDPFGRPDDLVGSTGPYTLEMFLDNGDSNGTVFAADEITTGTLSASIGADSSGPVGAATGRSKDVDFYFLTAPSAGLLNFTLGGSVDLVLAISRYDPEIDDLVEFGRADGVAQSLAIEVAPGDVLFIAVTGSGNDDYDWFIPASGSGGERGDYTLTTSIFTGPQADRDDDIAPRAIDLDIDQLRFGDIGDDGDLVRKDPRSDVDVYRMLADLTGEVTVEVDGTGQYPPDTFVRIYDDDGTEIAFNDDESDLSTNSTVSFDAVAGRTYFVSVAGFSTQARTYNILTGIGGGAAQSTGSYALRTSANVIIPVISIAPASANEGADITFNVTLPVAITSPVSLQFATRDGTGLAGTNYTARTGTLTIPAGQTSGTIVISSRADGAITADRTFFLDLSSPQGGTLANTTATGTVRNTDVEPPPGPDLRASISSTPTLVRPGSRNTVVFRLENSGTLPSTLPFSVALYASTDSTFDPGDTLLATSPQRGTLRVDGFRNVSLRFNSPTNLPDGNYRILAVVDAGNQVTERFETNNTAASAFQTTIEAPFIDLTGVVTVVPTSLMSKGAFATVRITNNGNVAATGSLLTLLLLESDAGGTPFDAGSFTRNLNLAARSSLTLRIKLTPTPGTLGPHLLTGNFTLTGPLAEKLPNNNDLFSTREILLR